MLGLISASKPLRLASRLHYSQISLCRGCWIFEIPSPSSWENSVSSMRKEKRENKNFTCPFDERVKYKNSTIVQFYSFDRSWIISSCFFVENIADIKRNILSLSQNINLYHRNCQKIIPVEIEYITYLIYTILNDRWKNKEEYSK